MQATLIKCDNPNSAGYSYVGKTADLAIGNIFIFGSLYSSNIKNQVTDNDEIKIETLNTNYTFKVK